MSAAPAEYELAFWGDCLDTFGEERKHFVYAGLMGIDFTQPVGAVLDIGSGPVSMLLKCHARGACSVLDPLMDEFPAWVRHRYDEAGIAAWAARGEDLPRLAAYDEAWIYNVLQHVDDPERVVANARAAAGVVRLFEWVGIPAYPGHPHELAEADLRRWLGGRGTLTELAHEGCYGTAFSGAFFA